MRYVINYTDLRNKLHHTHETRVREYGFVSRLMRKAPRGLVWIGLERALVLGDGYGVPLTARRLDVDYVLEGLGDLEVISELGGAAFIMNSPFQRIMVAAQPLAGWMARSHGSGKKVSCTASHIGVTPRRSRRPVGASTPLIVPVAITPDCSSTMSMVSLASLLCRSPWPCLPRPLLR